MHSKLSDLARIPRGSADPTARIRQAIVNGELFPNERLVEQDLVTRFQANRGAIRVALAVLEQQGLVVRELNRGARVRAVTEHEAIEIEEVRSIVEPLTARYAALRATPADVVSLRGLLAEMRSLLDEGNLFGYSDANVRFHQQIAQIAQHSTAIKILASLGSQTVAVQYRPILKPGRAAMIDEEHHRIVDAIAAGDSGAAELAMRLHLDSAVHALRAAIENRNFVRRPVIVES